MENKNNSFYRIFIRKINLKLKIVPKHLIKNINRLRLNLNKTLKLLIFKLCNY